MKKIENAAATYEKGFKYLSKALTTLDVLTKLADSYLSLFILGMLCNVMIYIAVDGYNKIEMEIGKYSSLCLGVMVFIICGFEHSIADMFYFWVKGGYTMEVVARLLVITVGNAVGGIMFHNAKKYMASLK